MRDIEPGVAAGLLQRGANHSPEAAAWAYPARDVQQWLRQPDTQPQDRRIAFLTFDDGPSATTAQVLEVLRDKGVHATFFVNAPQLSTVDPVLVQTVIRDGNAIALHTWSHNYRYLYPGRVANTTHVLCDVQRTDDGVAELLGGGYRTTAYRYPGGHMSWQGLAEADAGLAERDLWWIDWNAMSGDSEPKGVAPTTEQAMVAFLERQVAQNPPGTANVLVVLNHDSTHEQLTAESLPAMIDYLRGQGYEFGIIE